MTDLLKSVDMRGWRPAFLCRPARLRDPSSKANRRPRRSSSPSPRSSSSLIVVRAQAPLGPSTWARCPNPHMPERTKAIHAKRLPLI
jgi:hypothetical protein